MREQNNERVISAFSLIQLATHRCEDSTKEARDSGTSPGAPTHHKEALLLQHAASSRAPLGSLPGSPEWGQRVPAQSLGRLVSHNFLLQPGFPAERNPEHLARDYLSVGIWEAPGPPPAPSRFPHWLQSLERSLRSHTRQKLARPRPIHSPGSRASPPELLTLLSC